MKSWCCANPPLPNQRSFVSIDVPNVVLCAVRLPEDAFTPFALVIRVREADGLPTRCRVGLPAVPKSVVRSDHLERPSLNSLPIEGDKVIVDLKPFGIVTFLAYL